MIYPIYRQQESVKYKYLYQFLHCIFSFRLAGYEALMGVVSKVYVKKKCQILASLLQRSHRLEKYLNLECLLEKSLKIQSDVKSTGKSLKGLVYYNTVDRDPNQYKIVVHLFANKKQTILY